jgi:hypothetical protein
MMNTNVKKNNIKCKKDQETQCEARAKVQAPFYFGFKVFLGLGQWGWHRFYFIFSSTSLEPTH